MPTLLTVRETGGFCAGALIILLVLAMGSLSLFAVVGLGQVFQGRAEENLVDRHSPIDFNKRVLPILKGRCFICHGPGTQRSHLRVDRRASLLQGGDLGSPAIIPGSPEKSFLVKLIRSTEEGTRMPRVGEPLLQEQISLIEEWIAQGAIWPGQMGTQSALVFEREIRTIFDAKCLQCHGPDVQSSHLRVDRRASLLKGGDLGSPAIVPGSPKESFLLEVLRTQDPKKRMPFGGEPLSQTEIAAIENWIAEGAEWPGQMDPEIVKVRSDFWAFQPVAKPNVPVSVNQGGQAQSPIDAFLLAKLSKQGFKFNASADPRTLIRRVSIVLTGLQPSTDDVSNFVRAWNRAPEEAYRELAEHLLSSPHFGERWAQHWLDAIRWAESSGSESNYYRKNAWYYRDYLIRALNEDRPYNQFVREQIAGDVLGEDAATGFLVSGPHVPGETIGQEESAQKQARYDQLNEIVQTVGSSMMGITIGCARCHSHKFDPISIRDYYSMVAIFQDIEFDHRVPNLPEDHPRARAGGEIMARIKLLRDQLANFGSWDERWVDHRKVHFSPVETSRLRITFLTDEIHLDEIEINRSRTGLNHLALAAQGAKISTNRKKENPAKPPELMIDGRHTSFWGWGAKPGDCDGDPRIMIELAKPTFVARLDFSSDRFPHYGTEYIEGFAAKVPSAQYRIEVQTGGHWREVATSDAEQQLPEDKRQRRQELLEQVEELAKRYDADGPQPIFAGRFRPPEKTFVLQRGSPMSPGDEVEPAGLEVLDGDLKLGSEPSGPKRRLAFANWLASAQNPLTARVMVNRLWYHLFGNGIVSTPGDFGEVGARPSDPELLDWLAATFVEDGWSVKKMLRRMVMTEAFRQASTPREEALAIDADNKLLWRFSPRRVEAEVIRDSILVAADSLDRTVGGPSYRIHDVKKRFQQWTVVDNHGPQTWRRMIYQERMRGIDDRMFSAFDFPDGGQVLAKRTVSTTPLQAFNLMNGPLVTIQSEKVAQRLEREVPGDTAGQIRRAFELILNRPPVEKELSDCTELTKRDGLPSLVRALFNTSEFAFLQ